jgi:hypothetical protein
MVNKRVITIGIIFLFVGCIGEDDDDPFYERYTGTASAIKNGEEWNALSFYTESNVFPGIFSMGAHVHSKEEDIMSSLYIGNIKNHLEYQEITAINSWDDPDYLSSHYVTIIGRDALNDIYDLDTTAVNNFIQITRYNVDNQEIEGIFNVTLVLSRDGFKTGTLPQKLEFSNGKFKAVVQKN